MSENFYEEDLTPEKARQLLDESDKRIGTYIPNNDVKAAKEKFGQLNEGLVKRNPHLGLIDERVIYDKQFLLEVQNAGYNPLDKEDVQNYLEKLPPKDANRNMILCGADKYTEMGMSLYSEDNLSEFQNFMGKKGEDVEISTRKPGDVYLSDFNNKNSKKLLTEKEAERHKLNMDEFIPDPTYVAPPSTEEHPKTYASIEDRYRKHLSKVFGAEDTVIPKEVEKNIVSETGMIKSDSNTEKLLELIREFRALGFSPDEIKQEIKNLNK
jgi:hypothetical protein